MRRKQLYEIEVKVVTYRTYEVPGEDREEARYNFFAGRGEMTDEDDDTFEIERIEKI